MLCGLNGDTAALEDLEKSLKVFEVMGWSADGMQYDPDFLSYTAGYFRKYAIIQKQGNNNVKRKSTSTE